MLLVQQLENCSHLTACLVVAAQIELNWLLDDAVAAQSSSTTKSKPCSWRQLQSVHSTSTGVPQAKCHDDTRVALRLGLTPLTDLWKQRTQDRWVKLQSLAKALFY